MSIEAGRLIGASAAIACLLLSLASNGEMSKFSTSPAFANAEGGEGGGGGIAQPTIVTLTYNELRQTLRSMSIGEARDWARELNRAERRDDTEVVFVGFSRWMTNNLIWMMRYMPLELGRTLRALEGVDNDDERVAILDEFLEDANERQERLQRSFDRDVGSGALPEDSREYRDARANLLSMRGLRRMIREWRDNPQQGSPP